MNLGQKGKTWDVIVRFTPNMSLKIEAPFVGPVIGQQAQFLATKECVRFLRINNAQVV